MYHCRCGSRIRKAQLQLAPSELSKIGIFRFFRVFLGTFLQTPVKTFFEIFFAILGPEGPETPVNGGSGRNLRHPPDSCLHLQYAEFIYGTALALGLLEGPLEPSGAYCT